jgi:endoglucanase
MVNILVSPDFLYLMPNIKHMRSLVLMACCALLVASSSGQQKLSRVSVRENHFVANDTVIIFHGLNTSDPEKLSRDNHWNREYFEVMKSWGANL